MRDYPEQTTEKMAGALSAKIALDRPVSYAEQVDYNITRLETQLADAKRTKEILAANPEFEELLTLVGRNRF